MEVCAIVPPPPTQANCRISNLAIEKQERVTRDVPYPLVNILTVEELFGKNDVPDLSVLRKHLEGEGRLEINALRQVIQRASDIFLTEENLLVLNGCFKVIGALHGHFYDLLTIMDAPVTGEGDGHLFLGSYIHNGMFGLETVVYLFAMKIANPSGTYLLRGNQDCRMIGRLQFQRECEAKYDLQVYGWIMAAFDHLPLAAVLNSNVLCLHGGLSPGLQSLQDISQIDRVREPPKEGLMTDMLWADPDIHVDTLDKRSAQPPRFSANEDRGISYYFSIEALTEFLNNNNLIIMVRSNQPLRDGAHFFQMDSPTEPPRIPLVSLCSAPNLLNYRNKGGFLVLKPSTMYFKQIAWVPQPYILPNFMDAFTWSVPFLIEKVALMVADILELADGIRRNPEVSKSRRKMYLKTKKYPDYLMKSLQTDILSLKPGTPIVDIPVESAFFRIGDGLLFHINQRAKEDL